MVEHANGGPRTPRYNHKPIDMRQRNIAEFEQVGDYAWRFENDKRLLVVAIPVISHRGWIRSEWAIAFKNESDAQWTWDGNEAKPTLTPSLHAVGVWHGHVRDGKLVEA